MDEDEGGERGGEEEEEGPGRWRTKTYIISLSCFDFANPGHNVGDTEIMIPQCSCLFAVERFSLLRLG